MRRNLKYGLIILIGFLARGCDDIRDFAQPVAAQEIHAWFVQTEPVEGFTEIHYARAARIVRELERYRGD